jgi:hypothetical protein
MEAWAELFPYFTKDQIRHLIDKMKRRKILLVGTFNRTRYDRTQWYSVSDEVLSLYTSGSTPEKAAKQTEKPMCPPGQMDVVNLPYPSAPPGEWMWEKSHIEVADFPDRSGQIPTPIPYNKPDKKPAATSKTKKELEETAAAGSDEIKKLKADLSTLDYELVFDTNFYSRAATYLAQEQLGETYVSWLFDECRNRKPKNLRGLYYALFFRKDILALFRVQEQQREREKPPPIICPVCDNSYDPNLDQCPHCDFNRSNIRDKEKIQWHKQYCKLSPEDKAAYEREQHGLFSLFARNPAQYDAIQDEWKAIEKKYHLLE